jgi:hypothetical protein
MTHLSFNRVFALIATTAVGAAVVAGFWVLGTPGRQRAILADQQRLQDLTTIAQGLHQDYLDQPEQYRLPETLATRDRLQDPLTDLPYEYQRLADRRYQLCATFDTDSRDYRLKPLNPGDARQLQDHPQGRHCFEFDPSEYPD